MSGQESDAERNHEPSERKLEEARKRGDLPRSADLAAAAVYGGFVLAALGTGAAAFSAAGQAGAMLLGQADRLAAEAMAAGRPAAGALLGGLGLALAPFFALPAAAALLAYAGQRAIVFAPERIAPKLSRLSPGAALQQRFGLDGLVEFAKSAAKLGVVATILGLWLAWRLPEILLTAAVPAETAIAALLGEALRFLIVVAAVAAAFGAADWLWQRAAHRRRNRMTRQELIEEQKDAEGDPHVKSARRARAQEIATNRMLLDVARADVVVVNPTHYAVALRWDRASGRAPVCVAKGVDEIAARIRTRAAEAGVPIHRDPPTARALYATLAIGDEVPRDQYRAVAAAIRFAEAMRKRARARAGGGAAP
jgi:flagellar biosynthetic protein FlhB